MAAGVVSCLKGVGQRSPTFLAPGPGFVEDSFSTDHGEGDGSGGVVSDGERQMKLPSLAAHLLLCSPVPNRPQTGTGVPGVGDPWCREKEVRMPFPWGTGLTLISLRGVTWGIAVSGPGVPELPLQPRPSPKPTKSAVALKCSKVGVGSKGTVWALAAGSPGARCWLHPLLNLSRFSPCLGPTSPSRVPPRAPARIE